MNHADLDQLLILQEKDVRISKLRKELASLPEQRTRLLRQMEAIKQKALAAKQEVASVEKSIRDVEAAVETKRAYIGKMKTLQSNTRKNEEYQMCIQEVEKTEAAIDALETSELELMERLETAKTDMEQKIRRARDAQREMEETLARFDRTAETDKELLNRLNAERADLAAAVPEDSLGEYERMTKSKGVPVIVPMDEKGHCGGCHLALSAVEVARIKKLPDDAVAHCEFLADAVDVRASADLDDAPDHLVAEDQRRLDRADREAALPTMQVGAAYRGELDLDDQAAGLGRRTRVLAHLELTTELL